MQTIKRSFINSFLQYFFGCFLTLLTLLFFTSCASTVSVYYPPRFDLTQVGRLGIITFMDNANPSVADYATQKFQNELQTAQVGIPFIELGTEEKVLKSIGSGQLDMDAYRKIAQKYKVAAVFSGSVIYSDVKTDIKIEDITRLAGSVKNVLNGTLSAKLVEAESGATLWSDSTSWKRKLGGVSVDKNAGVSVGVNGYDDAYEKLVPDMVHDITNIFRGHYVKERVKE